MGSNRKAGSASKIKMESFDNLFGIFPNDENSAEQIINVPITELYAFKDHPFRVEDDEKMEETAESIRQYGVLVPGIARPRKGGGYEIIAGHRRRRGSELAGKTEMPMIVREYTDDEATIIMVDSNIQREDILPSEKAKAYKMKYEAMKHQGKKSEKSTLEEVGEAAGESAKKVQRYIWLSRLSDELLAMVDNKKIGLAQGLDISFLSNEMQKWIQDILQETECSISMVQSAKIKEYGKKGELTPALVHLILTEEKPKERRVTLKADKISRYFEDDCSSEEIEDIILKLLEEWKRKGGGH
ncbi:MAG: ParB/RepB/Spo0J family partition protein [Lachnospiraceae bacterium]|nr:ParB/RepB/Spo0J family partition protein [Lachnospiraceae bacterium]